MPRQSQMAHFGTNRCHTPCWRVLVSECESIVAECEPERSYIVAECKPERRDVCKPGARYWRAATPSRTLASSSQDGRPSVNHIVGSASDTHPPRVRMPGSLATLLLLTGFPVGNSLFGRFLAHPTDFGTLLIDIEKI